MLIKTTFSLILTSAMLATMGCSESSKVNTPKPPEFTERVVELMGGASHAKAITETGSAKAYRIERDADFKEITLSEASILSDDQRQTLVGLLARDDAYLWDIAKGCEPMNGVLVTFEDGATIARIRFCFQCMILEYTPGSLEDFDPINAELIEWAKGVFPDDRAIQSLGTAGEVPGL